MSDERASEMNSCSQMGSYLPIKIFDVSSQNLDRALCLLLTSAFVKLLQALLSRQEFFLAPVRQVPTEEPPFPSPPPH